MSAIADFRIIETSKLHELSDKAERKLEKKFFRKRITDYYFDYLEKQSKKVMALGGSAYVFADLLIFLKERKGIDLLNGKFDNIANEISIKRENATIIFTYGHREKYLNKLIAEQISLDELVEFNKQFSGNNDQDLAREELSWIISLKVSLELLRDESKVVLFSIG